MWNSRASKLFIAAALLIIFIGIALRFANKEQQQSPDSPAALNEIVERRQLSTSTRIAAQEGSSDEETQEHSPNYESLPILISREKIEDYLKLHNRDAASLLAAFHATFDPLDTNAISYLKEAATNFPSDPHVQRTVLSQNAFPEERRKWLDAFKESSPSNSLANYLSARDYFESGQPDVAVNELLAASGKSQFENYGMETYLGTEELFRSSGESPLLANTVGLAATSSDLLPELTNMRGIAESVLEAQKKYLESGDTASVENLSQMGLELAGRLSTGDGGKFIISQLVGIAVEKMSLQHLNQNTSYDFLGGKTPAQRLAELTQQRVTFVELSRNYGAIFSTLAEPEWNTYHERMKIYGEFEAMRWLQKRQGANAP